MYNTGILLRAMIDGIVAQRKLDGDSSIIATNDIDALKRIVSQGKRIEASCRQKGLGDLIEQAQKEGARP